MSTFVSMGMKWRKDAMKDALQTERCGALKTLGLTFDQYFQRQLNFYKRQAAEAFVDTLDFKEICKQIADERGIDFGSNKIQRTYFITIRPDTNKIDFPRFYELVNKFVQRGCFEWFELTYEQKSTEEASLGIGFHTHIIAKMNQRSKGEVLRDTYSTFKHCTAENCIQVDPVKTDKDLERTRAYMVEYKAVDGHKEITADADKVWRQKLGLRSLYTDTAELVPLGNALPYQVRGESNKLIEFS